MDIIGKRKIWYAISLVAILPGFIALVTGGLKLGIDFVGGSMIELSGGGTTQQIRSVAEKAGMKDVTVINTSEGKRLLRFRSPEGNLSEAKHQDLKNKLAAVGAKEDKFDSVGPSVSRDITRTAIISIILVSLAIVLYLAFAFRNVPPPASSWNFGVMAIVALLHDAFLVMGVFAILGHFFGVEIDALFVTALLTVIGFSVHDSIVVFDRIRENLRVKKGSLEEIVNTSILETLARSINTSLTVVLTLLALYLFGGQSTKWFILALLIGIVSGTYSSVFNASPLLVTWQNMKAKKATKTHKPGK